MPEPRTLTHPNKQSLARARKAYSEVQTRTVEDDPARWSKHPHEYGDVLITPDSKGRVKLGGALQRDLFYWIERNTWGANISKVARQVIRPEWAKLSLSVLAKLCGSDRRTVARSLADLAARGIIEARDRKGCGPTVAKMYKLTPERWREAPAYEPKVMEAAELIEEDEEEEAPAAAAELEPEAESVVLPGKSSRPQPVSMRMAKDSPAVTIRVVYHPTGFEFPVTFRARTGRNGRLQVTAAPHRKSEKTANECRVTAPQLKKADVENKRFNSLEDAANRYTITFWGKAADRQLVEAIVTAAGAAPVEYFDRVAAARFRSREAGRKIATTYPATFLVKLAEDAATAYTKELALNSASDAQARPAADPGPIPPEFQPAPQKPGNCAECNATGKTGTWYRGEFEAYPPASVNAGECPTCEGRGTRRRAL